jgi:tripartite ATP-independent transporter DctP family solute receptor
MGLLKHLTHVALVGILVATAQMANAQVKLRFAHTLTPQNSLHLMAEEFARRVAAKTQNGVQVQVFPAGQLGNDPQILDGVRFGTIDMVMAGNPFFTSLIPELNIFDLPFLFRDYEHAYKVLDGPIGADFLRLLEQHDMKPIGILELGFRNLTNSKRPVRVPEDVKGLRIRTTPNPAHIQAFKLLGANPIPMPITEVYLALSTGTVDGQENPTAQIEEQKFYEVQKYLSLTYHAYTSSIAVMNLKKFQALKPEQQKALQEAMQEARDWGRRLNRELDDKALVKMKAAGMQVEENPNREAFRKAVADQTAEEYTKKFGTAALERIRTLR